MLLIIPNTIPIKLFSEALFYETSNFYVSVYLVFST